jgi:putative flavoprotein involved in K+ transport
MTDLSLPHVRITNQWFADFEAALKALDVNAALGLFAAECYWRDLVSFTWNICTLEGPESISEMLHERLTQVAPSHFIVEGQPTESDGVIEAWFEEPGREDNCGSDPYGETSPEKVINYLRGSL